MHAKEYDMKISTLSPVQLCCTPRAIFKVSALAVALSAINILATTTEAAVSYSGSGTASYSTIGDLSIYQPPVGETKPTIMLMLDKSGSMGNFYRNNYGRIDSLWVDYGSLDYQKRPYTITEYIDRVEREYICTRYGFFGCKDGYWKETTVTDTVKTKYDYHTPNLKGIIINLVIIVIMIKILLIVISVLPMEQLVTDILQALKTTISVRHV